MGGRRYKQCRPRGCRKMWPRASHCFWRSSIACLPLVLHFVLGVCLAIELFFREGDGEISLLAVMSFFVITFLQPRWCMNMLFGAIWFQSQKQMNRLCHILHGNGPPSYGSGSLRPMVGKGNDKGKGKPYAVMDPEAEFAASTQAAIPEAARIRMQSKLVQSEWEVPVQEPQSLSAQGGVAICLTNVGYTGRACAVLVVQRPDTLGLYGYPRARLKCSFDVLGEDANRKRIVVECYLVQLGFSAQVTMTAHGDELQWLRWWPVFRRSVDGVVARTLRRF